MRSGLGKDIDDHDTCAYQAHADQRRGIQRLLKNDPANQISLVGWIVFQQTLYAPALIGTGLTCAGVVVINVFSKATSHWD